MEKPYRKQNLGFCEKVYHLINAQDAYLSRKNSVQNAMAACFERREKLISFMTFFCETFDKEFPFLSQQIQESLFRQWALYDYNKEVAQANIQITEFIQSQGNTVALERWLKLFDEYSLKINIE